MDLIKSNPIVLVGGGFAGLTTAIELSKSKPSIPIVLIDPRSRFIFYPLLFDLLSEEIKEWEVLPTFRSLIKNRNIILIQDSVKKIDSLSKDIVTVSGLIIKYSQAVIATGSKCIRLPDYLITQNTYTFSSKEDLSSLKALISRIKDNRKVYRNIAIVGGGFVGIELACKIYDILKGDINIYLIEREDKLLLKGKPFNKAQSLLALEKRNIRIYMNSKITSMSLSSIEVETISSDNKYSTTIPSRTLIWTVGMTPSLPEIEPKPIIKYGKIVVNSNFKVNGSKDLFAIGDISYNEKNNLSATAQCAIQQGDYMAKSLIAMRAGKDILSFEYKDYGEMLSLGIGDATITALGVTISGSFAYEIRRMVYLTKMPSIPLGLKSTFSWLLSKFSKCL